MKIDREVIMEYTSNGQSRLFRNVTQKYAITMNNVIVVLLNAKLYRRLRAIYNFIVDV